MQRTRALLPFVLVVLLYAGFRLIHLDHMAHGDERHWVGRSLNFYRALTTGEFQHTNQKEHPGVMTMWAGTLGYMFMFPGILSHMAGNNHTAQTSILQMWDWGLRPPEVLVALRASKVILQSVFLALSLRFLVPLIGTRITLLFGALLALSPAILGWDSWLHIDGLAAITAFAGITAVAYASEQTHLLDKPTNRVRWLWFVAGAICATSWLNRITGLMLVLVVGLALLIQLITQRKSIAASSKSFKNAVGSCVSYAAIYALGAAATTFVLFPALWVNPVETARVIIELPVSGARGQGPENFFPEILVDPGWSYYPIELFVHTTPFDWLGMIVIAVLSYSAWKRNLVPRAAIRLLPVMLIFAAAFVLAVSLSPKKAGQYMTIVYPIIIFAVSVGLVTLSNFLALKWSRFGKALGYVICAGAVLYSGVASVQALPYKNVYNNPFGLQITGQPYSYTIRPGYPQLAEYFIGLDPEPPTKVGYSSGGFGAIFPYLVTPSLDLETISWRNISSPAEWYELEYHIVGVDYPADETIYRYGVPPLYRLEAQGRVLWEVYPREVVTTYQNALVPSDCTTTFGQHVTLYQIVASPHATDLYFYSENGKPVTVEVFRDDDPAKTSIGRADIVPTMKDTMLKITLEHVGSDRENEHDSVPLLIYVYDAENGELLASTSARDGNIYDQATVASDCFSRPEVGT